MGGRSQSYNLTLSPFLEDRVCRADLVCPVITELWNNAASGVVGGQYAVG